MSEKIAPELRKAFASSHSDPAHRERVIITLEKGSDPAALSVKGVSVVSRMENLPIVVANIDAAGLEALAASEGIERVEQDETMRIPEDE